MPTTGPSKRKPRQLAVPTAVQRLGGIAQRGTSSVKGSIAVSAVPRRRLRPKGEKGTPATFAADAGTLDKAYIQKRIRQDFVPLAKECYEAALERDAKLGGKLVFSFVIVGDEDVGGIVESAEIDPSSTLVEKELVYCMRESLLSLSFEPPKHGGVVTVTYPFVFSPGDPDPDASPH